MAEPIIKPSVGPKSSMGAKAPVAARTTKSNAVDESAPEPPRRWRRAIAGWVLLPGMVFGGLFAGGVFLGVHYYDSGFVHFVRWCVGTALWATGLGPSG